MIHRDDAAGAFVTAAEAPKPGVWHLADDRPVPLAEFRGEMARRVDARPPRRMPRWLARMFLGRYGTRLLSSSFSTSNARFRRDFGWRPSFPTYAEGLEEVVTSWRAEGFPARRAWRMERLDRDLIGLVLAHFVLNLGQATAHFGPQILPARLDPL